MGRWRCEAVATVVAFLAAVVMGNGGWRRWWAGWQAAAEVVGSGYAVMSGGCDGKLWPAMAVVSDDSVWRQRVA